MFRFSRNLNCWRFRIFDFRLDASEYNDALKILHCFKSNLQFGRRDTFLAAAVETVFVYRVQINIQKNNQTDA